MVDIEQIVARAKSSQLVYCKFLSANDTGETGAHQCGIYVAKNSREILFPSPGIKGHNMDAQADIMWMNNPALVTKSRFIYYGQKTRNEYRITRFGKGFPYIKPDYIGSLLILCKARDGAFYGYVLDADDDIDAFLVSMNISSTETNRLLTMHETHDVDTTYDQIYAAVAELKDFPQTSIMSQKARDIYNSSHHEIVSVDDALIEWTKIEYELYRVLENHIYLPQITKGFHSVEEFKDLAAELMNRRKSRAGKSLENHLAQIFADNNLSFETQVHTENNKTCDFLFPSARAYHDLEFPTNRIITLGAKTTCKDRWRQVLNEANRKRGEQKFLCTLQEGISPAQLQEMSDEKLTLVVPEKYRTFYPKESRDQVWSIKRFVNYVKALEGQ